ncbi:MAG TPA: prephenate dehydratase [Opitutales bacterium]|nr:prephenate dehydratase [Opitutales bacterium]
MDLEKIRQQIDEIDRDLIKALNERLRLAGKIGELKRQTESDIYVPQREEEVFQKLLRINEGPLTEENVRAIYREIMSAAIALEKRTVIAYLGPEATYTHQAAMRKFGASLEYRPYSTIQDVFNAVEKGETDYGVVPVENSTEGAVIHSLDMLVESDLQIVAQVYLEIAHNLISPYPLKEIREVYSKDQALWQCRRWLQMNLPHAELCEASSTARAVEMVKDKPGAAAIAGSLAAKIYNVPIVAENIQDKADNITRFLIIGKESSGPVRNGENRSSFVISVKHETGALQRAIAPFGKRGINMTKIESRPSRKKVWDYVFFIDIVGHYEDPEVQEALAEIREHCTLVKWLGSYPNVT